jgi:hypothetical protein
MRLIKKSEQALLSKIKKIEELESQNIQADTKDIPEAVVENEQVINLVHCGVSLGRVNI